MKSDQPSEEKKAAWHFVTESLTSQPFQGIISKEVFNKLFMLKLKVHDIKFELQ